ncbi:cytochrome P450 2J4-like [Pituophis catenifer annectens]|uniref:cytochrome P450 2J4-like n=1 Tax=Pituophis catenifer annectens TaxID=94852 RepID=UPI0039950CF2
MVLLLLLSLSVVYFLKQLWLLRKCPPGPLPLPLIGISWRTGFRLTPDLLIQLYEVFPWLMRHIPGPHQKTLSHIKFIYDLAKEEIEKHKENQSLHEPRDFIDYYLLQLKRSKDDPSNTYDEDNLAECIVDFFIAGTETSATSLQWALLFITNHSDVQDKVYKEIQNICSSGLICYQDRKKLPYTNAVIHEIQRIYYVLSFGIARRCRKDMNMLGFYIPKGSIIVPDLRSVLLDPMQWETPDKFNPNHFLDRDGNFVAREEFLPFGAGARKCLGEQISRMEIFLVFTNLLMNFRFQLPRGVKQFREEPLSGLTVHPHSYKVCAIPRHSLVAQQTDSTVINTSRLQLLAKCNAIRAVVKSKICYYWFCGRGLVVVVAAKKKKMEEVGKWLLALFLTAVMLYFLKQLWSRRNYPPGPFPLPFIGVAWQTGIRVTPTLLIKLAKRYGNIYTIWSGHMAIVVFSGFQAVKEALIQTEDFAERQMTPFFKEAFKNKGIIFSNGPNWKQQRRFGLITMRKLGLGKKGMENRIEEEAHRLVKIFARAKEQPLDPSLPVTTAISNLICIMVFGYRFSAKDEKFQKMLINLNYYMKFGGSFVYLLYELFPRVMKYLPGYHQRVFRALNEVTLFAKEEVEKHRELQSLHDPQDFIDYYLLQMEKTKGDPESAYDEENLAQCIVDFFIAGTETTATTLQWALLLMVAYPEIQEKVRKEIEDTLDPTHSICYQDRVKLPYTYAVIHEVMRLKYVLIAGVPRQSAKDVNLYGYHIPKGTLVVTDLNSVLYDPKRWETPEKFNPHHFLDKDGHFISREDFLAFGAGPRVCLGEQMARMELFLFVTILLRSFKFQLPEGVKELSLEPIVGLSLHPHPYKLCAVPHCRTP